MDPKSVLIVGMSSRKGSVGHLVLQNLQTNDFKGEIYLLGRNAGEVEGIQIHTDAAQIPDNIDLAVLTVPAASVEDSIALCITKRISTAITLAGGFAELGEDGRDAQNRILALAREGGLAVIGPNCLGFSNFTNSVMIGFVKLVKLPILPKNTNDAVAIVGQSGGIQSHLYQSLESRGISISYNISTGNEMDLGLGDFVNYLIQDPFTRVIAIYAEHIGNPERFIWAAREAAKNGKPIVLLHSGRSVKAQESAKSHTGSLVGNHAIMSARLRREGIVLVETLDELLDVTELLSCYPLAKTGGLGVMSLSGAFSGIAHDLCADIGIEIPELSHKVKQALLPQVPAFIPPKNPLDLGTQPLFQPELIGIGLKALVDEPGIGAVVAVLPLSTSDLLVTYLRNIIQVRQSTDKPIGLAILNDGQPLPQDFINLARDHKIVISRSPDRTIRGIAKLINRGNLRKMATEPIQFDPLSIPALDSGVQVEWRGKQILRASGVSVPDGNLVRSIDDAIQAAVKIGYPVVLKAQSAKLAHKTEAGGVAINLKDEAGLRHAWEKMTASVHRAQPDLTLDGMLVEAMSSSGLELVIGATRDPAWGPMIMVGIGGIHVEVLNDVRLIAPEADTSEILEELNKLTMAKLLHGFRNQPPVDVEAVALAVTQIGQLMLSHPSICEIDVNPLMVQERGQGATALDALIVVG